MNHLDRLLQLVEVADEDQTIQLIVYTLTVGTCYQKAIESELSILLKQ